MNWLFSKLLGSAEARCARSMHGACMEHPCTGLGDPAGAMGARGGSQSVSHAAACMPHGDAPILTCIDARDIKPPLLKAWVAAQPPTCATRSSVPPKGPAHGPPRTAPAPGAAGRPQLPLPPGELAWCNSTA